MPYSFHALADIGGDIKIPQPEDNPAARSEARINGSVSSDVSIDLCLPVRARVLSDEIRVSMPERTVDEDGYPWPKERQVGPPWEIPTMKAVTADICFSQSGPQSQFRKSVLATDRSHYPRTTGFLYGGHDGYVTKLALWSAGA